MIEEDIYNLLNILTILILAVGGVMATWICLNWQKVDKNLIKAKIFLNEKFLRKLWFYMFIAMVFFGANEFLILFFGATGYIALLAEVFKVVFVILIVLVLMDYYKLVKSCVRSKVD